MNEHHTTTAIDNYRDSPLRGAINNATARMKWVAAYLNDVDTIPVASALEGLAAIKQLRRWVRNIEQTFTLAATAEMAETGTEEYTGTNDDGEAFTVHLRESSWRTGWNHDSLINELTDRYVETATIRHPDLSPETIRRISIEAISHLTGAGRIEWRSTVLRELGINPDEFSTRHSNGPSVDLRGDAAYTCRTRQKQRS